MLLKKKKKKNARSRTLTFQPPAEAIRARQRGVGQSERHRPPISASTPVRRALRRAPLIRSNGFTYTALFKKSSVVEPESYFPSNYIIRSLKTLCSVMTTFDQLRLPMFDHLYRSSQIPNEL